MLASASPALGCTFSRDDLKMPKSSDNFFGLPYGAIAIAEQCDPSTNLCQKYYDITACTDVEYPVLEFDDPTFSIVINTSKGCADIGGCPIERSYLAAAVVYINNQISRANLPTIEVIRSAGWIGDYSFDQNYKRPFDQSVPNNRVALFFKMQAESSSSIKSFEDQVIRYFHATPATGGDSSWAHKEIFGDAFTKLNACASAENLCTLKSYLFAFSETPKGIPTVALRVNAVLANSDGMYIATYSPAGQSIYNKLITVHFKWPPPIPKPRPAGGVDGPSQ
jgi:hypothetical protein